MSTAASLAKLKADRLKCINPGKSAVVTACAGSGKTWLLTSRILRIILNDPKCEKLHRILAITFTNNAAAEIQTRVKERLRELAYAPKNKGKGKNEKTQAELLEEIGLEPEEHADIASIYRTFITKRPTLNVFTFHSWFSHLIQFLPWDERTSFHSRVADSPEQLKQRAWEQMLEDIKDEKSDEAKSMRYLLGLHKLRYLKEILDCVIDYRAEWHLYFHCSPEDRAEAGDKAKNKTEGKEKQKDAFLTFQEKKKPKEECTKQELLDSDDFRKILDKLRNKKRDSKRLQTAWQNIEDARQKGADVFFQTVWEKTLVRETARKYGKDLVEKEIAPKLKVVKATHDYIYNKHCARIGILYAREYAKLKEQEGVIDYADMEIIPLRALFRGTSSDSLGEVLSPRLEDFFLRLDDSYDHILIDEFQDTSPAQWLMLRAWLQQSPKKPRVFIVGDPKQSVYSWRGGNPQLLDVARDYLQDDHCYETEVVSINHTRRCSQKIVDAVNEVFSNKGDWALDSFETHEVETEKQKDDSSLVLCFQPGELSSDDEADDTLRNPLDKKAQEKDEKEAKATIEGELLAGKVKKLLERGYANKDIMILHPKRPESEFLIAALAGEGLSCSLLDKSSRMNCLECQDMLALLHAIFDPSYGLMVAQVLRSPVFGVSEDDLWAVYQAGLPGAGKECNWVKGLELASGSDDLTRAKGLLCVWRDSYRRGKLPAHELLAQCYKDANIIERYVESVPQDIAKRVVLNLDWILNYSLEAQGGRLVLPSEYAAHLRELSEAGEKSDLADEGDNLIRSLTVHGAKGLESKVVIVVNSDYRTGTKWDKLLVNWDLTHLRPSHFSFCRGSKYATECQEQAWEKIKMDKEQEKNNLLYVAMTRARQHLFFSKRPEKQKEPKKETEGESEEAAGEQKKAKLWEHVKESSGNLDEKELDELRAVEESPATDGSDSDERRPWIEGKEKEKSVRTGRRNEADNEFKIKGTQRHNLLALILQNENAYSKVMKDNQLLHRRLLGIGKERLAELHEEIEKVLNPQTEFGKLLAQVDKKKNPIECELSAIGKDKKIRRIDCLLTSKDGVVWIIDFKTGGSAFEDKYKDVYDEQLRGYHEVVSSSASYKDRNIKMAIVDKEGGMREVQPA